MVEKLEDLKDWENYSIQSQENLKIAKSNGLDAVGLILTVKFNPNESIALLQTLADPKFAGELFEKEEAPYNFRINGEIASIEPLKNGKFSSHAIKSTNSTYPSIQMPLVTNYTQPAISASITFNAEQCSRFGKIVDIFEKILNTKFTFKEQSSDNLYYKENTSGIFKKFVNGFVIYNRNNVNPSYTLNENDKIAVCISGGKDSFLLAKCMQEIKKHGKVNFELEFIVMNPGYNERNLELIKENASKLQIPIHIFDSNIFDTVDEISKESPCYLCARMRRGNLYSEAKKLGCNKIALGHHFDDVIETILLSIIYGGEMKTMMPKLHSTNFEGMELIRPLYYVKEQFIINWSKNAELKFLNCACKFTEKSEIENNSKRKEIKELINHFRKINPYIETNIFKSSKNVNIDALIELKKSDGSRINFLDRYDDR